MRAKLISALSLLAIAGALSACNAKAPTSSDTAPATMSEAAPAAMSDMSGMAMDAGPGAKMGSGVGVITAIDKAAGTLTIKHDAIPAIDWPAMTMMFKANPTSVLDGLKVGDKISFDVEIKGSDAEVTSVTQR